VSSSFLFENVVPRMTHRILFISEAKSAWLPSVKK
jgi:hypothetical protein